MSVPGGRRTGRPGVRPRRPTMTTPVFASFDAGSPLPLGLPPTDPLVAKGHDRPRPRAHWLAGDRLVVALLGAAALLLATIVVLLLVQTPAAGTLAPVAPTAPVADRGSGARSGAAGPATDQGRGQGAEADRTVEEPAPLGPTGPATAGARVAAGPSSRPPPTRSSSAPPVPSAVASAKTGTGSCPCPADDLMCHMRCSVRK
jgi:hypothetical protein